MSATTLAPRCVRCCRRHEVWVTVGSTVVCGRCATLEEFGAALGVVATVSIDREAGRAKVGDRVRVTLEGELVSYDEDSGHWTLRGCSVPDRHVTWEYTLHWGTSFVPLAAQPEAGER